MKHIIITGRPGSGHVERAKALYQEHTRDGHHSLLDAPGDLRNSLPERSVTAAHVLVTARDADRDLTETIID